ncbi:dTDP-4-amino-4,6-dideoxygalactose transaminase [Roseivirga pacifica]|uniref:GDP-perosamine synthase n=1 Tax=Roseivirga pacifica TaxID=1267423 RepID=A0A1I0QZJ5_9BACT|nr:aminotransferase class I/II-fold pyridoxal phosphate-dependent enzyme [Roseivirga pacifica]RKQ42319.1 dTDP-4-amino-4,6-dideoxygalactose transaminase [Roseivirga pacifica]SEW33057.1 dTDP-4-amino-4,6-dideoxygalactose transaminase [Roseivirga pacifica]
MEKSRIWLSSPHMGGKEQQFVKEAFDTNWVAPLGPNVDGFEHDLQNYAGVANAAALTSGTAAIHLALIILGIERGDEVLVSTFTFSGSINPIVYQGAVPITVDSEPDTWNLSPEYLEQAITERIKLTGKVPKALVLVHLYGMPAKLDEIVAICEKYNVVLIEDAAEALGSSYKGKKLGAFGDLSIYSFNGNKIITTSGGGALLSENEEWIKKARFLATQARDNAPHYQHSEIGYNYRMSNIVAGIGRGQMKVLDEWVEKRRAINKFYREVLSGVDGATFLTEPNEDYFSNYWLTTILIDEAKAGVNREFVREELLKENIESRPLWKPMHMQPVFMDYPQYGNGCAERLFENGLCLPSGSNLTKTELDRVESALRRIFNK